MEILSILERKIENLVSLLKELKSENSFLEEENFSLREKVSQLKASLLHESEKNRDENS